MSKFLNRIAPQDEVLLETDIGTMVPSAEQLAEERVTRFNADKEIRLRVKTLEDTVSPDALAQAVERAETAKGDAVKAQGEASKSAEQASTSASNASKSAQNAKTSEQNAKTTADSLNAGLATLNGLDGRVTKIETGEGVYKSSKGDITVYKPAIIGDGDVMVKRDLCGRQIIDMVERGQSDKALLSFSDGNYVFVREQSGANYSNMWIFDKEGKTVARLTAGGAFPVGSDHAWSYGSTNLGTATIVNGFLYVISDSANFVAKIDLSQGDVASARLKTVRIMSEYGTSGAEWHPSICYNSQSGHLCVLLSNRRTDASAPIYVRPFDLDLNLVSANEDGTPNDIDVTEVCGALTDSDVFPTAGTTYVTLRNWTFAYKQNSTKAIGTALLRFEADDTLSQVYEDIPDVDAEGYIIWEKDEDGNEILDEPSRHNMLRRPQTTRGEPIKFFSNLPSSRGVADAYTANPMFFSHRPGLGDVRYYYGFCDGIDTYLVLSNGKLINAYRVGEALRNKTAKVKRRDKYTISASKDYCKKNNTLIPIGVRETQWGNHPVVTFLRICTTAQTGNGTSNVCFCQVLHEGLLSLGIVNIKPMLLTATRSYAHIPGSKWGMWDSTNPMVATYNILLNDV